MQIMVRDNNVEQALRALKKKLQREGVYREMKLRRHYEKPSEKRAREKAAAVRRAPPWAAVALSAGGVVIGLKLTCYYSAVLVLLALLAGRHPPLGAGLVGLSALGWVLVARFAAMDEIFTWISLATALFVVFATLWVWRARPVPDPVVGRPHPRGS